MKIGIAATTYHEELMEQMFIKNPEQTIRDLITSHIAKLGENIQVGRFQVYEI